MAATLTEQTYTLQALRTKPSCKQGSGYTHGVSISETPLPHQPTCAALPSLERPEHADAWVLVLTSQNIRSHIVRDETGFVVHVPPADETHAIEAIQAWMEENRPRRIPIEAELTNTQRPIDFALAYGFALALLAIHYGLVQTGEGAFARRIGSANAYAILDGELWRVLTALTLHKDFAHAIGNTLIGGFFLASLSGRIGAGVAIALALGSGALGNLADAIYYQTGHNSIGASTAVFGVVGLLCGLEAWRRERVSLPWRGAWVPLGAGVALLAMLGSGGEDVDYGAHILGMLAGMGLGYVAAPRLSPHPPGRGIQILSGFSALALLGASWLCAWTFVH